MFTYDFMINAWIAATIVALVAGLVGPFVVLRGQSFSGHALAHVAFTGATGAALAGWPPVSGVLAATVLAGAAMGWLGDHLRGRDVAIGMVLAFALGLGLLFLHFFTAHAGQATALLFGNVLGVDRDTILVLAALGALCLAALAVLARPLLFASTQPELAEARGVNTRLISVLFMVVVALAIAQCVQIVGVLLVFTLLIGPAAAAWRLTPRFWAALGLSVLFATVQAWGGLALAYGTDWPASFWITALGAATYLAAGLAGRGRGV